MQTGHDAGQETGQETEDAGQFERALGASYRLVDFIDRGATGEVWRAVDRRTDETVAAKLLRAEHVADQALVGRFVQERSVLTGLRHPNLVAVRDLVVEGDRLAIVMDYVDGGSLRDLVRSEGPLTPEVAVGLVAEVLDGLAAAHEKRLVHRDIKPDNVLLTRTWRDLGPGAVKLTDFGIARIVGEGVRTTTGLLGTPEYMSPEMLTTGAANRPADVYGIGILLYELLAGRTPFAGPGTDYTVAHRHVTNEPPPLDLPEPLQHALAAMLDKDPAQRPQARDGADVLRRLRPALAGVPALAPQAAPDAFEVSRGPVTQVRGLTPSAPAEVDPADDEPRVALEDLDLGTPGSATVVRPMARPQAKPVRPRPVEEEAPKPPWFRDPRVLGAIAGVLVLVVGVVYVSTQGFPGGGKKAGPTTPSEVKASQADQALPSGLTITRSAQYDPAKGQATLTVTYSAQRAPLGGPFLEVIPGATKGTCPSVRWQEKDQHKNLPTVTGIDAQCGWSVDPGQIDPQGNASVTATVGLKLPGKDPQTELQGWLDGGAGQTLKAVSDQQVTSTAYPVQRIQTVQVVGPSQTVTGKTLPLTLLPVWPKGPDQLNPIYRSPSVGQPSSLLTAIAGGEDGVRFAGGCSGAITVSNEGLVVTTLNVADQCEVNAQVGNFTDLKSNTFSIASRGG